MCASWVFGFFLLLKWETRFEARDRPLGGCSFFPRDPDGVNYLSCSCIVTVIIVMQQHRNRMQLCHSQSKLHLVFKRWLRVSRTFHNAGLSLSSRYSRMDKQQIFCAPVRKNQWGPSKYGYISQSQSHSSAMQKQYWLVLLVQGCRPCIIAVTATVSQSKILELNNFLFP